MAEQLDLTVPFVPTSKTFYRVTRLLLDWDAASISIVLISSDGLTQTTGYANGDALALMTALNSANLSVKSLQKRILEKLVTDGKLPSGTVSGTPA